MKKSETITKIAPALIKFNSEVKKIEKDGHNPFLKTTYATLDSVIETIRPVLSKNKLAVMQDVESGEGTITVKTLLLHESGEWIESEGTTLRLQKADPQGAGAAITYARRYDLSAFLSLNTGEDDDGNSQLPTDGKDIPDDAILPEQVGMIKTKALKFGKMRNRTLNEVLEVLKITDIEQLNQEQAHAILSQLNKWIEGASDKNDVPEDKSKS